MGEMRRAIARKNEERQTDRFGSTLVSGFAAAAWRDLGIGSFVEELSQDEA
ncbi:MAG TPA: hypothetical protein VGG42_07700 [Acidobacteriaceae bacterium]